MTESSPPFTAVGPVRPAAPYIGGKRNLSKRLVPMIEAIPHRTYAEPFVGMGGVFLRRRRRPEAEVINDWSKDVATFYRVLQRHYAAFLDMLKFQITTRAEFERLMAVDPETQTDLERAAQFLYLQRTAFGGKVSGRNFGMSAHSAGRFNLVNVGPMLEDLHDRLAGVIIERLPFADFVRRYDRPETLFYFDPPYWGGEGDYGQGMFSRDDFEALAELLAGVRGAFLLSINDVPETRRIFAAFALQEVDVTYTLSKAPARTARELIVRGGAALPTKRVAPIMRR